MSDDLLWASCCTKLDRGRDKADHSATYFSHSNEAGNLAREKLAEESLESLISWLKAEGNVGIMGESSCKLCC